MEAQIHWYEAYADLGGEPVKLKNICDANGMASGAAFHCAYLHATQQAFLAEAHELAFAYFGGVFCNLPTDNLTSAVRMILAGDTAGKRRRASWRFVRTGASRRSFRTLAEPH